MRYIQVEITRDCMEKCIMCPHRKWKMGGKMSLDVFKKLSDLFPNYDVVYLQGWGEPLLHPDFEEMLLIAEKKAKTGKTGFTTNGRKLKKFAELITRHTDYLLVSFSGVNSGLRGVSFDVAMEGVEAVSEVKRSEGGKVRIGVSYMLTEESWRECTEFVRLSGNAGVEYIAFTNLDYVFDETTDKLRVFGKKESKLVEKELDKAKKLARKLNIRVKAYPLKPEEQAVCEANPHMSVAISCEGNVYPCIYLALPFERITRLFEGRTISVKTRKFGNFSSKKAWIELENFREHFRKRIVAYNATFEKLMCSSPFSAIKMLKEFDRVLEENPPPEECSGCYKLYGV